MTGNVFFEAQRIGTEYRGLVIDSKTFDTVLVTAHNYPDATVAVCAARAMYAEKREVAA